MLIASDERRHVFGERRTLSARGLAARALVLVPITTMASMAGVLTLAAAHGNAYKRAPIVRSVATRSQRDGPAQPDGEVTPPTPATPGLPPAGSPAPIAPSGQATPPKPTSDTQITALPSRTVDDGTTKLRVRLSSTVAPGSPVPMLTPRIAGTWKVAGNAYYFTPTSTLQPCSTYTLTVWAATTATGRLALGKRHTTSLSVACPSIRGLQQALARLGYLPYTLHSAGHSAGTTRGRESRQLAAHSAYNPPTGKLVANVPHAPGLSYGRLDTVTRGALMVFQGTRGITPTGVPDGATWESLLAAETFGRNNPSPYTFVTVSESIPETLEVHRGSHLLLSTPANTGVPGAATERGTFPIYARYVATTMSGTNPDGTHYKDPGVPWVNYFNGGDAVHGFPRPSYGSPQSNGCVELPIGTAASVYRMLAIGDLVIVS
jgi:peptidoglycan hydrolase-like protein with peptidoglycan-binding domain